MGDFLFRSLLASVVLTVILNVGLRFWPRRARSTSPSSGNPTADHGDSTPRVKVYFPWKAMLALSIGLTIVFNVIAALR